MKLQAKAKDLLSRWRGASYSFGPGCIGTVGDHAVALGRRATLVASPSRWMKPVVNSITESSRRAGLTLIGEPLPGARSNTPHTDVLRLADGIRAAAPDVVIAAGGGSTIDAVKAALALAALNGGESTLGGGKEIPSSSGEPVPAGDETMLNALFGTGQVTAALGLAAAAGCRLPALVAAQTAASSAAHLTKYSNVTDLARGQKKLIVDEALVPPRAVFDYALTHSMPDDLRIDGAFDGIAHCLEVYWGAGPQSKPPLEEVALTGVELIVKYLATAVDRPDDAEARVALGLGTDLGGYAIMLGGTNGPHLNSFSLVDLASHGRACALLLPYWTAFFAPALARDRLRRVAAIYQRYGYIDAEDDLDARPGSELGAAIAAGMLQLARKLSLPARLGDLPGFDDRYISRALAAAKDPKLAMKLRNMPVPLDAALVDEYMRPVLTAAVRGDLGLIRHYRG